MYNTKPTLAIFLDTRRPKQNDTYPVKLRVTFQRKRKYYSILKESISKKEFLKVMIDSPRGSYKVLRDKYEEVKDDANQAIKKLKPFSFEEFEKEFFKKSNDPEEVFGFFQLYIDDLKTEKRINTADSYFYAMRSIQDFCNCKKLPFERITKDFLEKYEKQMLEKGKSISTVGIYTRCLRTIVNQAINRGITKQYPFGKGKQEYLIKNPPARKIALTTKELKILFSNEFFESKTEQFYFDLWKFPYLCGGINVKDICHLKYNNIVRGKIYFKREKSKRTNYHGKEIIIAISDEIEAIFIRWGQEKISDETYVFDLLNKKMTPEKAHATVKQTTKQIIKYVNRVSKRLGIDIWITSQTARHSFATQLMRHGTPTEFISKQMGHSNVEITNFYLENFEDRQLKKWQEKLLDFDV